MVVAIALFIRIAPFIFGKTYIFPEGYPGAYETGNIAETGIFLSPFGTDTGLTAWMMPTLIFNVFGTYSAPSAVVTLTLLLRFCRISILYTHPISVYHHTFKICNKLTKGGKGEKIL